MHGADIGIFFREGNKFYSPPSCSYVLKCWRNTNMFWWFKRFSHTEMTQVVDVLPNRCQGSRNFIFSIKNFTSFERKSLRQSKWHCLSIHSISILNLIIKTICHFLNWFFNGFAIQGLVHWWPKHRVGFANRGKILLVEGHILLLTVPGIIYCTCSALVKLNLSRPERHMCAAIVTASDSPWWRE